VLFGAQDRVVGDWMHGFSPLLCIHTYNERACVDSLSFSVRSPIYLSILIQLEYSRNDLCPRLKLYLQVRAPPGSLCLMPMSSLTLRLLGFIGSTEPQKQWCSFSSH
jgi:hypothetical protein